MPWCPKCRYEYLPEYSTCSDCGIELVDQEPTTGLHMPKTTILGVKPDFICFVCVVSAGFIAHAIFMVLITAGYDCVVTEQIAIAMLVVCLLGLFVVPLIPLVNPARILSGSILGGVAWFALLLMLSMPTEEINPGMPSIWDFVEFAESLFVVSATLTAVSTHRWHKNHSLRQAVEIVLLIVILTGAPYAIKYLYDILLRHGALVFINLP